MRVRNTCTSELRFDTRLGFPAVGDEVPRKPTVRLTRKSPDHYCSVLTTASGLDQKTRWITSSSCSAGAKAHTTTGDGQERWEDLSQKQQRQRQHLRH